MSEGSGKTGLFQRLCSGNSLLIFSHSNRDFNEKRKWAMKLSRAVAFREVEQKGWSH